MIKQSMLRTKRQSTNLANAAIWWLCLSCFPFIALVRYKLSCFPCITLVTCKQLIHPLI